MSKKPVGWRGESFRHSQAARGIKTSPKPPEGRAGFGVSKEFDAAIFQSNRMSRKPVSWNEVTVLPRSLVARFLKEIFYLPTFQVHDEEYPLKKFPVGGAWDRAGRPQWFVAVSRDGQGYLVDTEGHNYARYIAKVPRSKHGA